MGIPLRSSCKKHSFDFALSLRCNVIVGRIDLESGRSVGREGGLYFLPAVHILLSSLDGFDMAHILEKSSGSGNSNQSPLSLHSPPFSNWLVWRGATSPSFRSPPAWPRERMWATASYNNAHGSRRGRGCTAPLAVLVLVFAAEMSFPLGLLSVSVSYHFQTREESLECDPT